MGSWVRSWAVADAAPGAVPGRLASWLERKGYSLRPEAPLAPGTDDDEPVAFVLERGRWSVVVYSRSFDEGDRLRRELDSFPIWLELWIADSDAWGYTLFERHEATAQYASRPGLAPDGAGEIESAAGIEHVAGVLGLSEQLNELRRIERQRGLFADDAFDRFCAVLGLEEANLTADELRDACAARPDVIDLRGWKVRALWFERTQGGASEIHQPRLHRLPLRRPEPSQAGPEFPPPAIHGGPGSIAFTALRALGPVLGFGFRIAGFILAPLLRGRRRSRHAGPSSATALLELDPGFERRDGWLVNTRHRCRMLAVSGETEAAPGLGFAAGVFVQRRNEHTLTCTAMRAAQLAPWFTLHAGTELVADTCFEIGGRAARHLQVRQAVGRESVHAYSWFIEKSDRDGTLYSFQCLARNVPLGEADFDAFDRAVRSFEFLPDAARTSGLPH